MYNDHALLKFKMYLETICLDVYYRLSDEEPEIKEEYYTKQLTDGVETEDFVPDNEGSFVSNKYMKRDQIWGFDYNGSPDNSFFTGYSSLEKALIDELNLNSKTVNDLDEVDTLYEEFGNWLKDKVAKIQYKPEIDSFECDYIRYGEKLKKITFKSVYDKDIQEFYKELKYRLMQTYSLFLGKIPAPTYKPNLKWGGTDTDLIELITAMVENNSITVKVGKTSRTEVVRQFEQIFNIKLKDAESKLSRATERNDMDSKIIVSLQLAYKKYVSEKLKK